ncbi:hypothetical protein BSL78_19397 [Apostichopus japonicus]|uniref:EGF-like domain-containing protein n=1 Tax=Stichopus japonicus TaxID=307972 RepID=A0A2G8K711_STIJA|nr:hypothetical protein BSL78_19397 [Apostichopus japonicus]
MCQNYILADPKLRDSVEVRQSYGQPRNFRLPWPIKYSQNRCENGATCIDLLNRYACECVFGHEGELCDVVTDYCASNPCAEGSSCLARIGGFSCLCPDWLTGDLCEENVDRCLGSPCQHGSTCVDSVAAGYRCLCTIGYVGLHCQTDLDDCHTQPCHHGGSCVDLAFPVLCIIHLYIPVNKLTPLKLDNSCSQSVICVLRLSSTRDRDMISTVSKQQPGSREEPNDAELIRAILN